MTVDSFPTVRGSKLMARLAVGALLLFSLGAPARMPDESGAGQLAELANSADLRQLAELTLAENSVLLDVGKSAERINAEIPFSVSSTEPMSPFRAMTKTSSAYPQALNCLTQAIYYEAANEPLAGKRGVAQVVLNRVRHPAYPATVCGVVYEGWDQPVCQFSFVCDGSLRRTPMAMQWRQSREVAEAALAGFVEASVGTATHYHADYVVPRWAYTLGKITQIGHHIFYRFPGRGGRAESFTERWAALERIPQIDLTRFDHVDDTEEGVAALAGLGSYEPRDPTDRRAENDLGGRIDPNRQWRLAIPDPVNASAGYVASQRMQLNADHSAGAVVPQIAAGDAQP